MTALTIAWTLLRYLWPVVLLGGAYWWADDGWHNGVARKAEAQLVVQAKANQVAVGKIRGQLDDAQSQLTNLAILANRQKELWAAVTLAEADRAKKQAEQRRVAFARLADVARRDGRTAAIRIPADSLRVLADAHAAAEPAGPAEQPQATPAADSNAAALIAWGVDMNAWAAECKARVSGWESWYDQLRSKQ